MKASYIDRLSELARELVNPERYGRLALAGFTTEEDREPATVSELYPDLPQASLHYFPERPEDLG